MFTKAYPVMNGNAPSIAKNIWNEPLCKGHEDVYCILNVVRTPSTNCCRNWNSILLLLLLLIIITLSDFLMLNKTEKKTFLWKWSGKGLDWKWVKTDNTERKKNYITFENLEIWILSLSDDKTLAKAERRCQASSNNATCSSLPFSCSAKPQPQEEAAFSSQCLR